MVASNTFDLCTGWELEKDGAWIPIDKVPTDTFLEVLKHHGGGSIAHHAHPFVDMNELEVRALGEQTWNYRCRFDLDHDLHQRDPSRTKIVFEGLDTFAVVSLNSKTILETDNAFRQYTVPCGELLLPKGNVLEISFAPAREKGLQLVKDHPEHRFIVHQTEISRGPVRKPQYHFGWDWGPILLTGGIWKPIYLKNHASPISKMDVSYELSKELDSAAIYLQVDTIGDWPSSKFTFVLEHERQGTHENEVLATGNMVGRPANQGYEAQIQLEKPPLWWPRTYIPGYSPPSLIRVKVMVHDQNGRLEDTSEMRMGLRNVELVREKDQYGESFYFRVNGVDVFTAGSCWIPADSFLTNVTKERYRDWMNMLVEGNHTMVRVWGGGIYESDHFYDACDEMGILVWQDFAFACANYPTYDEYRRSVEEEARSNVRRLCHHPSLVIWAGNNEDYQLIERYQLNYDPDDQDPESWLRTDFPARYYYEHLLPRIVKESGKGALYWPSSPWGNGRSTTLKVDPTVGDIHQWNIWHGEMQPYQKYPQLGGRYVSEFGVHGYPHLSTIASFVTDPAQRHFGSRVLDFHNKAIGHDQRMLHYLGLNFRLPDSGDLTAWVHLTQIMQADAMTWAYRGWRRQWGSPGKRQCGGALVWQLNDCWPTVSWSVVDYYGVRKPAFYAIKRSLENYTVGVTRRFHNWTVRPADKLWHRDTAHVDLRPQPAIVDVWVTTYNADDNHGTVRVKYISVTSGKVVYEREDSVAMKGNATTNVLVNYDAVASGVKLSYDDPFVVVAELQLRHPVSACRSLDISWPEPIKYLEFDNRGVRVEWVPWSRGQFPLWPGATKHPSKGLKVSAQKPVKGFVFDERPGLSFTDNGFDIMPGFDRYISVVTDGNENMLPDFSKTGWRYVGMRATEDCP